MDLLDFLIYLKYNGVHDIEEFCYSNYFSYSKH